MSDNEGRIRFSADDDFEGGRWIGDEFYYESEKKKNRKMNKEDAMLGIFADDDYGQDRRRGGGGGRSYKPNILTGVQFVPSSSKLNQPKQEDDEEEQEEDYDDDDNNNNNNSDNSDEDDGETVGRGLGFSSSKSSKRKDDIYSQMLQKNKSLRRGSTSSATSVGSTGGLGFKSADNSDEVESDSSALSASSDKQKQKKQEKKKGYTIVEPPKVKEPPKPIVKDVKKDQHFGQFLGTSGIGKSVLNMMLNMGWDPNKGRLGKNETGILNPIQVKQRRKGEGISYGDLSEMTEQTRREFGVAESDEEEAEEDEEAEAKKRKKLVPPQKWKKQNKKKRIHYKTAEEVLAEERKQQEKQPTKLKIVDMTGRQARVITSMDEIAKREEETHEGILPELRHNLRLLVDLAEEDLRGIDKKLRTQRDRIVTLEHEHKELEKQTHDQEEQLNRLEEILRILTKCDEKIKQAQKKEEIELNEPMPSLKLHSLVSDVFDMLRHKFPAEYETLRLAYCALVMVAPLLKKEFATWDPLAEPQFGTDIIKIWQTLLQTGGGEDGNDSDGDSYNPLLDYSSRDLHSRNKMMAQAAKRKQTDVYSQLISEIVLPKIRSAIANQWNPKDPEPALHILENWIPHFPRAIAEHYLDQLILPKIRAEVDKWNPRQDLIPIHTWIHPWLPVLGHKFELHGVYNTIRFKISNALTEWHPSDNSAYLILEPWKKVFDPSTMEQFLARNILPKLSQVLANEFTINPQNQALEPFHWVLLWRDMFHEIPFVALLETHFFPKFLQVLYAWLTSPSADFIEITNWYQGWKKQFPEPLQTNERIVTQFNRALAMMNQAVNNEAIQAPSAQPAPPPPPPPSAAQQQLQQEREKARQEMLEKQRRVKAAAAETEELSFRELLAQFAEDNDIKFLPKGGLTPEGKPMYSFGGVTVYLDNDLIYQKDGERWKAVSMEDLLNAAKAKEEQKKKKNK